MTATNLEESLALATYAPGGERVWVVAGPGLDQQVLEDPRPTEVHVIAVDSPLEDRELALEMRGT
ncbi:hypothetical protein [Kocuria sp. CPCC 205263]|uniref:hypothetical protein n=1 Tax=Kocuria sp. CPCC 205263 TaxID=3073555 RepID=UPI0034D6FF5B